MCIHFFLSRKYREANITRRKRIDHSGLNAVSYKYCVIFVVFVVNKQILVYFSTLFYTRRSLTHTHFQRVTVKHTRINNRIINRSSNKTKWNEKK